MKIRNDKIYNVINVSILPWILRFSFISLIFISNRLDRFFTRFSLTDRKFYFHQISKFETNIIYMYIKKAISVAYILNNIRYNKFENFIYIYYGKLRKIYGIKMEREREKREGGDSLSREEDAQQMRDLSSAMQML